MTSAAATLSLAAFNSRGGRGRSRGRARGNTRPQAQRRTFCRTCYEGEKGRSTYLSHNAEEYNCPSKIKLNTLADDVLPPEVLEFEQETEESETDATQVESTQLSVINTPNTGLKVFLLDQTIDCFKQQNVEVSKYLIKVAVLVPPIRAV